MKKIFYIVAVLLSAVFVVAESPENLDMLFGQAYEEFLVNDYEAAAQTIKEAVETMQVPIDGVRPATRGYMTQAIEELDRMRMRLDQGTMNSQTALKDAFGKADLAMVRYFTEEARQQWVDGNSMQAADNIRYSADYLEKSAIWAAKGITPFTTVINEARQIASNIKNGETIDRAEVYGIITDLELKANQLSERMP